MKYCPECHQELPDEAHFCPRCTYEYPKQDVQMPENKAIFRKGRVAVLLCVLITGIGGILFWTVSREKLAAEEKKETELEEYQKFVDENFRTGNDIPYNPAILYELRDALGDYESVKAIFDMEPQDTYEDSEYKYYQYGSAILYVENDEVKQVYIDYSYAKDEEKAQYGIYGFNGFSTRDEVYKIMGDPDNYGRPEWIYYFDGLYEMPILYITFDENDNVKQLSLYHAMELD